MKPTLENISLLISFFAICVYSKTVAKRLERSTDNCGIPKINSGLIFGGGNFSRGYFPWIVALTYTETHPPKFFCAATILTSSFVVTGEQNELLSKKTYFAILLKLNYIFNSIFSCALYESKAIA